MFRKKIRWPISCLIFLCFSCTRPRTELKTYTEDTAGKEQFIARSFATMLGAGRSVQSGDLITRTGNDFTSYSLKSLNQRDQTYSHCGIASMENDSLFVYHALGGEWNPDQKIRRDPWQVFGEPCSNTGIGIFRFDLPAASKEAIVKTAREFYHKGTMFDMDFDLTTDDRMYCAEFVYKSFIQPPGNRLSFHHSYLGRFEFIGVDDLFLQPLCKKQAQIVYK